MSINAVDSTFLSLIRIEPTKHGLFWIPFKSLKKRIPEAESMKLTSPPFLVLAKSRFFLLSYSEKGAEVARALMTVIRTTRLNQADSEKYIAYVLTQLGKIGQEDIDSLLPWSETLPKEVRSSKHEVLKSVVDSIKKDKYE